MKTDARRLDGRRSDRSGRPVVTIRERRSGYARGDTSEEEYERRRERLEEE